MLKKNVYILYSPGYCGNFINWSINISDSETRQTTIDNPINNEESKALGGFGTSHLHTRIPTHQGVHHHLIWTLHNKPTDKRVYTIGAENFMVRKGISYIAQYDPDGVFINIHNDDNDDIDAFGTINMMTKWPTFLDVKLALQQDRWGRDLEVPQTIDPYNCATDRDFRNWIVHHHDRALQHNGKMNYAMLDKAMSNWSDWYDCRNRVQPHEVNEQYYMVKPSLENRVFELSCKDVCSDQFVPWFNNFMNTTQISDDFDTNQVSIVHPQYIEAQANLQWFESIKNWEDTGKLDNFLTSHSGIEALVIVRMMKKVGKLHFNWEHWSIQDINLRYQSDYNDIALFS